jgi:hypothetical protein
MCVRCRDTQSHKFSPLRRIFDAPAPLMVKKWREIHERRRRTECIRWLALSLWRLHGGAIQLEGLEGADADVQQLLCRLGGGAVPSLSASVVWTSLAAPQRHIARAPVGTIMRRLDHLLAVKQHQKPAFDDFNA